MILPPLHMPLPAMMIAPERMSLSAIDSWLERKHGDKLGARGMIGSSMGGYQALAMANEAKTGDRPLKIDRFVAINPPHVLGGAKYYGSAFLPAAFQGTPIGELGKSLKDSKIANLAHPRLSPTDQRKRLDLLQSLNRDLAATRPESQDEIGGVLARWQQRHRHLPGDGHR